MSGGSGTDQFGAVTSNNRYYMVFGSHKSPIYPGGSRLVWNSDPIGVFEGRTPAEACQAAASQVNAMGTFFAIEGTPWGLELMTVGATELGRSESAQDRLSDAMDRLVELQAKEAELRTKQIEDIQAREASNNG